MIIQFANIEIRVPYEEYMKKKFTRMKKAMFSKLTEKASEMIKPNKSKG